VGQTDSAWVFTAVENLFSREDMLGSLRGQKDIWKMYTTTAPKSGPPTAQLLYGGVMKAWKNFEYLEKRFNSKIVPAEGWAFSNHPPKGNATSIKNYLLDSGLMSEEALGGAPRKYEIKLHYKRAPLTGDRNNPPPGFFSPKYSDPYQLVLIINGKEFTLSERAVEKLDKLRVKGNRFMNWMFGEYYYGGETKVLTRKREGKEVMAWMAENLPGLPETVLTALKAASTAEAAPQRRRRW
jgi:hypothetical protein